MMVGPAAAIAQLVFPEREPFYAEGAQIVDDIFIPSSLPRQPGDCGSEQPRPLSRVLLPQLMQGDLNPPAVLLSTRTPRINEGRPLGESAGTRVRRRIAGSRRVIFHAEAAEAVFEQCQGPLGLGAHVTGETWVGLASQGSCGGRRRAWRDARPSGHWRRPTA